MVYTLKCIDLSDLKIWWQKCKYVYLDRKCLRFESLLALKRAVLFVLIHSFGRS